MIKIIESPYYFSVHSDNVLNDEKYNFFGLLDIKQNRFYILHRNHALLKFLQLILLKNFYTFSIVSFKHFNFSINKNIDNHDCITWGGTAKLTNSLELEADTSLYEASLIKTESILLTATDLELQEKMFFVMNILTKLDSLFKKIREHEIDIKNSVRNGYNHLKKYLEIICTNDKNVVNFINEESEQLQTKSLELDTYWNRILLFFYNANFRNNSIESILNALKEYVQMPKFELERFKRVYQYPHNALDELYKILGITLKN
jgi:hypothetical protein